MARTYATGEQYATFTGQTAPADITARLAAASRFLDANVFRLCWYEVDEDGLPSAATVAEAFALAACEQARWGIDVGDTTGAEAAGYSSVSIGSVSLSRGASAPDGSDAPGRQIAPAVWDALRSPDMTPELFLLGVAITC